MPTEILEQSFRVEIYCPETKQWEPVGDWSNTRAEADEKMKTLEARPGLKGEYQVTEILTIRKAKR